MTLVCLNEALVHNPALCAAHFWFAIWSLLSPQMLVVTIETSIEPTTSQQARNSIKIGELKFKKKTETAKKTKKRGYWNHLCPTLVTRTKRFSLPFLELQLGNRIGLWPFVSIKSRTPSTPVNHSLGPKKETTHFPVRNLSIYSIFSRTIERAKFYKGKLPLPIQLRLTTKTATTTAYAASPAKSDIASQFA